MEARSFNKWRCLRRESVKGVSVANVQSVNALPVGDTSRRENQDSLLVLLAPAGGSIVVLTGAAL